ncbi:hypothetical protein EG327_005869 [Venturia inaequalis]|uniref:2',3'-cyclic-nucleotide 3'-phosphodiesterase n=1 Tax=Venturia inaequalis TaxID=5025 RepID=A0A8H3VTH4_VENIN|nr:hypothetical protein EG327_005869 [Venturia inaequalis]
MPGASLWLVPPQPQFLLPQGDKSNSNSHGFHIPHLHLPGHAKRHPQDSSSNTKDLSNKPSDHQNIHETLTKLINTLPSTISTPSTSDPLTFVPHITLTSGIDLASLQPDPKAWLERIAIPEENDITVSFTSLETGPTFTKKLLLRCGKAGLQGLAELSRWQAIEAPNGLGSANSEDGRRRAEEWVGNRFDPHVSLLYSDAQVSEQGKMDVQNEVLKSGVTFDGTGDLSGWKGGSIWLVDTSVPIAEWQPIAERKLKVGSDSEDL